MKVNLKNKTILKIAALITVLVTTIAVIFVSQSSFKTSSLTEEQLFENNIAKSYTEFTNEDKNTNVENVKFGSYFLRDLEGNNVAHMLGGTCKQIGEYRDELYFDIQVNGDSYIDNAKIKITNENFKATFNYLKDDYLKYNYKGTYSEIEFNRIDGGSEEQIYGSISTAVINNYNDYSKTAIVTFTCDYHDIYTGEVEHVEKQVPITVDWYGYLNTQVDGYKTSCTPKPSGNTVSTSFRIKENSDLLLKDRIIEIKVPNIRQWQPVTARLSDGNAVYDAETQTLTLHTESVYDAAGNQTTSIPKETSYTIFATYPEDAFYYSDYVGSDDIFHGRDSISFDTTVTTYAYSNQSAGFENIVSSENTVYPTVNFHEKNADPAPLGTTLVVYYEHQNEEISIQKILENYERVKAGEISASSMSSYFDTHITVQRGAIKDFGLLELTEEVLKFGSIDVTPYLKDTRIYCSGLAQELEDDGSMLIYNADTDELIKELSVTEIRRANYIYMPEDVSRVKIEIKNFKKCEGSTSRGTKIYAGNLADIYIGKTLDVNAIINDYDYTTLKNLTNYFSRIRQANYIKGTGTLENTTTISDNSKLKYNRTEARMVVNPKAFANNGTDEDDDDDEIGEHVEFIVSSYHQQDRATWGKGEFILELPQEINYFNLDSVTSSTCTINGYEYFEDDGKKLIRVFAETDATILFTVNAHVIIDPMATNGNKYVDLYYKNEACQDYYWGTTQDKYDVDLNGDKEERVGIASGVITITSPSTFIVKQIVTNYDENGSFSSAPNVAEVDKEENHATVEIMVKNNNASPVIDCYLVGKILYEGNTKVKAGTNLNSQFTTHMTSDGITVPEELENVTVYYSENDSVNFDLNDISNEWKTKDQITDWSKVKTFAIDLSQVTIRAGGNTYAFTYDISIPNGLSYNDVSYCTVASKYNLQTSAGVLYGRGTEAQKTGIRIVRKYDVEATLLKETTNRVVPDENYVVEELDDQGNVVKTKMGRSDSNGKFLIKNLYAERNYRIRQTTANSNYEKDESVRYFRLDENAEGDVVFSYPNNQSDLFNNTPNVTKNSETNKDTLNVTMWQTPKYEIVINKLDRVTEQPISNVNFLCYSGNDSYVAAKTNDSGIARMSKFSEGTNYTLEEVTAKGYYLQDTSLRLNKNAQYNYSVAIGNNEFVHSATATNGGASQDLATVELTLYNNAVPTYTLNVVKIKETRKDITSSDIVKISGAEYELTKYDDNEKETITTGDDGKATVENMYQYREGFDDITGKYGLQEKTAPDGYVLNKEYIEFVVSKNTDDTLKIEYKDEDSLTSIKDTVIDGTNVTIYLQDKSMFKLTKTDDDQRLLPNIGFVIYELDANGAIVGYAKDVNGEYIGTQTANGSYIVRTDSNGEIALPIRDGEYIIYEVEAPAEYEYSTTGRRFKVKREEPQESGTGSETTEEKYTYQVQYYYNGQRDDSKTETYEVDKDTEITEYVDKIQDGYELQYVTKLPYKIECDDLAIDVYYATPKTDTLEINYIEDLIDLQIAVNNGNHYENTKVVLKKDLDFNDNDSYRNYEDTTTYGDYNEDETTEGIKTEVTSGRGWKSIGITHTGVQEYINGDYVLDENNNKVNPYGATKLKYFAGTFDGNNHSISNMYVNLTDKSAYKNEEDKYVTTYSGSNETEHQDYYNAALFGWTHNATIINLKFDADIYEGTGRNGAYNREIGAGAGLVGNSYGSINLFNVENNLTGNFCYGGAIGRIYQRINTNDIEKTNINVQDVKNTINTKASEGFTVDYDSSYNNQCCNWSGLIGFCFTPSTGKDHNSYNDISPEITQNIEINNVKNVMKDINGETNNDEWGVIGGMSGASSLNPGLSYSNDTCKLYKISSDLEAKYSGGIGGAICYMNRTYMSELKINGVKSKTAFEKIGSLSGGICGYIYPTGTPNCVIENFEVEMNDGEWESQVGGVYGYASGNSCTINIKNGKSTINNIKRAYSGSPIVGSSYGYGLNISNVNSYGKIIEGYQSGGIIGYGSTNQSITIENVNNYMDIVDGDNAARDYNAGIVGAIYGPSIKIKNAKNYGKIQGSYHVGGIIGRAGGDLISIENCANMGEISGTNLYEYVGGLIGSTTSYNYDSEEQTVIIKDSYNTGNIKVNKESCYYVGGLIGYNSSYNNNINGQIQNCYNKGNITILNANYAYEIGGLHGNPYGNWVIQDCYNEGNIDVEQATYGYTIGGIVGNGYSMSGQINNVINKGHIRIINKENDGGTTSDIGGIAGVAGTASITNTINQGDIEIISNKTEYRSIGGIAGQNKASVYNAYNTGNITLLGGQYSYRDNRGLGGIVGTNYEKTAIVSNCYNTGKIVSTIKVGGVAGYNIGTIEDCYNEGKVTSYREDAGSIVGLNCGTISNVYNVGNVVAKNRNVKLGPVVGESYDLYNGEELYSQANINNLYYSDKVAVLGEDANDIGTKQQDDYMRTPDFYNTLNENDVWIYVNKQYPKLLISAGEEIPEAVELEVINEHKIYNITTSLNNPDGGTITGSDLDYVEQVRHGTSNTQAIEMIPADGYEIVRVTYNREQQEITLNDDGSYRIEIGQIENITNDLDIYVEFSKQDQMLTITKVDKDTNEILPGATFEIEQIESGSITDDVSGLKESNIPSENAADINNTVDSAIGTPIMTRGSYSNNNGTYSFNGVYYKYQYSSYIYRVDTKIPINLSENTGNYVVRFESTKSWDSYQVYKSNNELVESMTCNSLPTGGYSYTIVLAGGESYYISMYEEEYRNSFTNVVSNFHVYAANDNVYNMTTTEEGYFETTNNGVPLATSAGNVEVDLTNHPEEYTLTIKYKRAGNGYVNFNMNVVNMDTNEVFFAPQYTPSADTTEKEIVTNLLGGTKYKVEFNYKNVGGLEAKLQITEFKVEIDESKLAKETRTTNEHGEIRVELPVGKYVLVETTAPEHYLVNVLPTVYDVDINKENKVTIQDDHKPIVRVHHYLMENGETTTKKVAEDEEYEGNLNEDYYFNPKDRLPGLSLAKDDNGEFIVPDNYKGKYALGVTDVNFYYEAEDIKLTIHHYLEGTQTKIAEDEVIVKDAVVTFKRDQSYEVSTTGTYTLGDNANYQSLTQSEYNLSSVYSEAQAGLTIDDTLEYASNTELIYNYNIKKYRIVTRVIEHDEIVTDDEDENNNTPEETNEMTNTTSNEIANTTNETSNETTNEVTNTTSNEVTNTTTNETTNETTNTETTPNTKIISVRGGTISGYDLEYYEELASNANSTKDIVVTPDRGYKIKEIKLNDTVIYDADHTTNDLYTVDDGVVTFNKFNNVIEDKTITVEFEGVGSIVKVHHVLVETGKEDVEYKTVEIRGRIGSRYTTEAIEIPGYTLDSTSLNTTGEIAEDQIDVYYNYKANPEVAYTIRYFYDTVEDTELAERLSGKMGTTVTVEDIQTKIDAHKKDVYEFERAENIPLMIANDVDEYVIKIYYLSTYGKVTEKHIDAAHNTLLFTETHKGAIGANYNIQARNINGFTLKTVDLDGNSLLPTNAQGTYQKDVVEIVTYYYSRNTTVKVIYQDENETELEKEIIEGHEGDEYKTEEKTIKGYELVEVPKNAEGVMTVTKDNDGNYNTETVVTYKYKKLIPADVIEKYVDVNTNEVVEEVIHKGELDEEYEITPKTIEGYTLMTKDKDGNDILPTNTKGKYTTEKVEVVYYVAMNTTVRVQYINLITGEKMTDDVIIEGYEGKDYVTEPKTFDGYELTSTPENAKGTMKVTEAEDGTKVTEVEVKYYYAEILDGNLPQTSETNTKQAILIAVPFVVLINLALGIGAFKKNKREDTTK